MPYIKNPVWTWYGLKRNNKILAVLRWWDFPKTIDFHHPIMHGQEYEVVEVFVKEIAVKTKKLVKK